jgi:cytochrome c-type biogenesis protein CcmF
VGYFFLVFLIILAIVLTWLVLQRLPLLRAESQLESMVSREASFLFNNLLLVGIAFSVLWGTMFPILSELVRGTQVTVGPPFFNQVNIPIGLGLLALTGIGPLIAWRKASTRNLHRQFVGPVVVTLLVAAAFVALGVRDMYAVMAFALSAFVLATVVQEFSRGIGARHRLHGENYALAFARLVGRNRRRYGGYIVHVGIVIFFVGFAGNAFKNEMEASLKPGETATMRSPFGYDYTFTHVGVSQYEQLNRYVSAASVQVMRGDERLGIMTSEKRQYWDSFERPQQFPPSTEPAIESGLREDLYIVYAGSVEGTEEAVYRFTLNPLVWWLWFGGVVLVVGGVVTMWPGGGGPTRASLRRALDGYQVQLVDEEKEEAVAG